MGMCAHSLYKRACLLLPARFYGFRACTRAGLEEKILAGRVHATFSSDSPGSCLGVFFIFDTDLNMGGGLLRWHTCCLGDGLSIQDVTSILHGWAMQLPTLDESGSSITANMLSLGPFENIEGKSDVEPIMQEANDALKFSRRLSTHLRVYRMQ